MQETIPPTQQTRIEHHRIICIGRSGSGKSVLQRWWCKRAGTSILINSQKNIMPASWIKTDANRWPYEIGQGKLMYIEDIDDVDMFVTNYYEWALSHPGTMLGIDECSLWSRSKLSTGSGGFLLTAITRARTAMHTCLSWHSTHQVHNVLLMNADYICFFDSGQSMEIEREYLGKYYAPLVSEDARAHLAKPYHWILYDVKGDTYRLCSPVEVS